jgi:hypothetical protein
VSGAFTTALTNPEQDDIEQALRRVLYRMAGKLDEAQAASFAAGVHHMATARRYARRLDHWELGAWVAKGPCAGLSMLSGLLADIDIGAAVEHVQEFAELSWRARSLNANLSPYADDLDCREFVGAHDQLKVKLKESMDR